MRRVVSLFLPTWPTDRIRRRHGLPPRERPLVTLRPEGGRRMIAAADAAARARGLTAGMSLAHAQALLPDLVTAPADPAADAAALGRLAGWLLRRYSPLVAPEGADGLWLDIGGCAHLFGGERPMLAEMTARLESAGISARAALADTPGAAWALARFAAGPAPAIVPPGHTAAALAGLPVAALRLPAETVAVLRRLGFETIGQLENTARAPLARRCGREILRRLDQALGTVFEPITPLAPPDMPRQWITLPEPTNEPEVIAHAIGRLLPPLCRDLEALDEGARCLDLRAQRVDGRITAVRIGTARPSREPGHLAGLLLARAAALDPGFGIEAIELLTPVTEPLRPHQLAAGLEAGLGEDQTGPDLSVLVDRLRNRLGADRLYRLGPVESDLPERSVRRLPPLAPPAGASWPAALERPSRLLHPPEPVKATALLPDHPPLLFVWRQRRHRVRQADGPERVFGEWWHHPAETATVRDYFCVVDEEGARFWLFREESPEQGGGRWYLHGLFG